MSVEPHESPPRGEGSPRHEEKEGKAPVSCARFGTQRKQAASPTSGSLEPVPFVILPVNDTLVPRLNYSSPSFPGGKAGLGARGGLRGEERGESRSVRAARVLSGDAHFYSNNRGDRTHPCIARRRGDEMRCSRINA